MVENGRRKSITKLDAAVKAMVNRAVKGDAKALQQMLALGPLVGIEATAANQALEAHDAEVLQGLLKRFQANALPASNAE